MTKPREAFPGRRVLVTGASGFIGGHLCKALLGCGAEVHGVSRKPRSGEGKDITWWQGDLSEIEATRRIVSEIRPDYIFHLAGYVSGNRELSAVVPAFRDGLSATVNLLISAAEAKPKRIVLAGSMEEPPEDQRPAVPCSPYAAAKWAGGGYGRMFNALYGTPVTNARIFMVYGEGQRDVRKLVPYVILSLLRGENPKLGGGRRSVDWIHVSDVVDGLMATALAPGVEGLSVDIGTGTLSTVRSVVERLFELVGSDLEPTFGTLEDRPLEVERVADIQRSRALLGWGARISLDEGLERTVNWYRERYREGLYQPAP